MIQCALNVAVQLVQEWEYRVYMLSFFFLLTGLLCTQEVKIYWVTSLQTLTLSFFETDFFLRLFKPSPTLQTICCIFFIKKKRKFPFTGFLPSHAFGAAQEAAKPVNNNKDIKSVRYTTEMKKTKQQTWRGKLTCGTEDLGEAENHVCADEWLWLERRCCRWLMAAN